MSNLCRTNRADYRGWPPSTSFQRLSAQDQKVFGTTISSRRMADGKLDGSTTLVEAGKLSIVKAAVRSREHFPFAVSGMNENSGPIYLCRIFPPSLQHALL